MHSSERSLISLGRHDSIANPQTGASRISWGPRLISGLTGKTRYLKPQLLCDVREFRFK
jgi:hypothetical protein